MIKILLACGGMTKKHFLCGDGEEGWSILESLDDRIARKMLET